MLASGAHIKLGGYEFVVDESQENHYVHSSAPTSIASNQVVGSEKAINPHSDKQTWILDDWSGGHGNYLWDRSQPDKYWDAVHLNPRVPGVLMSPSGGITDSVDNALTTIPGGGLNNGAYHKYYADGDSVQTYGDSSVSAGGYTLGQGTDTNTVVLRGAQDNPYGSMFSDIEDMENPPEFNPGLLEWSAALLGGRFYAFNGERLYEFDVGAYDASLSDSEAQLDDSYYRVAYTIANGAGHSGAQGITAAENSLFLYTSVDGISSLHEYNDEGGAPVWTALPGEYIRATCYAHGLLWVATCTASSLYGSGLSTLYAFDIGGKTMQTVKNISDHPAPVIAAYASATNNNLSTNFASYKYRQSPAFLGGSAGEKIWICSKFDTYIYDLKTDGISRVTGGTFYAISAGTQVNTSLGAYAHDSLGSAYGNPTPGGDGQGKYLFTGWYDFGTPYEKKTLLSVDLSFFPLSGGKQIKIWYQIDNSGTWVLATTADATDTSGFKYTQISTSAAGGAATNTVTFQRICYRIEFTSNDTMLYSLSTSAQITPTGKNSEETWEIALRLKDEPSNNARPRHRAVKGETIRDWLLTQWTSGAVLQLLDGYRYEKNNTYTTNDVVLKQYQDHIDKAGEGYIRVLLGRVAAT